MVTPLDQSRSSDPRFRRRVVTRIGVVDEVFCISCGHHAAYVLSETPSVVHICGPESRCGCDCLGRFGGLPLPEVSDEDVARYAR